MPVTADYARVIETMRHALPAYVAYVQRAAVLGMGAVESKSRIVVRTSDKKVVHGSESGVVVIAKEIFDPACYRPTGEATASRNGRTVMSFTLARTCNGGDKVPFTTLYVDPASMRPIEATGTREHEHSRVSVRETFSTVRDWSVPASLKVDIEGNGLAFWLQIHALKTFSDYGFYASDPGPGVSAPAHGE
jgi:hypothetical protein